MNNKLLTALKVFAVPTGYAIFLRFVFGINTWGSLFSVMSVSFLFCLPTIVGILTVYFSPPEKAAKRAYYLMAPWVPIGIFMLITIAFRWEGWACWLMVLPLFALAGSVGGSYGSALNKRKHDNKLYISAFCFLPLLIAPLEKQLGAIPGTYKAYTVIDIHASGNTIWKNVTRVREIPMEQDKGWLTKTLGFPRPVRAELNYNGIGAYRKAIFTNGLVFDETVLDYQEQQRMVFRIQARKHEIPSTTMDEHVVIGGDYFDVLNGTYELEPLNDNTYRLHLYSNFKLSTTFNFYASWWARWIMQDIQNNILQVIKARAESEEMKK